MPQPLPPKYRGAVHEPNPIKGRPEAAAALGNALAAWNHFERDLVITYSIAMGFYLPGIKGWSPTTHPLAFQIFDTLAGLGARLDLLERCVDLVAKPAAPQLAALRPEIRRIAGKRAEIAHAWWGVNERYPKDLIMIPQFGDMTRWTPKDFDTRAQMFIDLRTKWRAINKAVSAEVEKKPWMLPNLPPQELTELIARLLRQI